jgi:hypothetical protein
MKNAIVCLTRGYQSLDQYNQLIRRNISILNRVYDKHPLIFFHEGNITSDHQEYIRSHTPSLNITFIDISHCWAGGYEGMCRFNMVDLWDECEKLGLDYILRIDEDCEIYQMPNDPFEIIRGNDILRSCYFDESHSETNATLPQVIEQLTGKNRSEFYNTKFLYTNVYLSSVKFWNRPEVMDILSQIAFHPLQRSMRWGDLPVLGSLANIYAKVGVIDGLVYRHLSHDMTISAH